MYSKERTKYIVYNVYIIHTHTHIYENKYCIISLIRLYEVYHLKSFFPVCEFTLGLCNYEAKDCLKHFFSDFYEECILVC